MTISRRRIRRLFILLLLLAGLAAVAAAGVRQVTRQPAEAAAVTFLQTALELDPAEERAAWDARLRRLTTERGWAFWEAAIGL